MTPRCGVCCGSSSRRRATTLPREPHPDAARLGAHLERAAGEAGVAQHLRGEHLGVDLLGHGQDDRALSDVAHHIAEHALEGGVEADGCGGHALMMQGGCDIKSPEPGLRPAPARFARQSVLRAPGRRIAPPATSLPRSSAGSCSPRSTIGTFNSGPSRPMGPLVDFAQAAIDASPDVLLIIDTEGILRWASPSLASIGYDPVTQLG